MLQRLQISVGKQIFVQKAEQADFLTSIYPAKADYTHSMCTVYPTVYQHTQWIDSEASLLLQNIKEVL